MHDKCLSRLIWLVREHMQRFWLTSLNRCTCGTVPLRVLCQIGVRPREHAAYELGFGAQAPLQRNLARSSGDRDRNKNPAAGGCRGSYFLALMGVPLKYALMLETLKK